ncbi:MAG: hypothetical protein QXN86_04490 [Candidatus Methanomethylicaceae archaeon]
MLMGINLAVRSILISSFFYVPHRAGASPVGSPRPEQSCTLNKS